MAETRTPRSHLHPCDINNQDPVREIREARRAIDGAAGRKARKLRNRAIKRQAGK